MKKLFSVFCLAAVLAVLPLSMAGAVVLTFDTDSQGLTLGGEMTWNGTGGGHLYMEEYMGDDFIYFSSPTLVTQFQMNGMPWENYGGGNLGLVDIAAFDVNNQQVWSTTVDLSGYAAWSDWLTVPVNADGVSYMAFYSPYYSHGYGFWPSIDNMVINQGAPVPIPGAVLLLGSGLAGLAAFRRRILG